MSTLTSSLSSLLDGPRQEVAGTDALRKRVGRDGAIGQGAEERAHVWGRSASTSPGCAAQPCAGLRGRRPSDSLPRVRVRPPEGAIGRWRGEVPRGPPQTVGSYQ